MADDARSLVSKLRAEGITDERVLKAIADTPRALFVEGDFAKVAYADRALPIACGQTISQPYIVAYMTQALEVSEGMRVLEIGTGSGYQAAVLARLAGRVYTIERHLPLLEVAKTRFEALGLTNIVASHGDGFLGWPEEAPFDRIVVTAAFRELPENLTEQLTEGGIFIAPVGYETISQRLSKMIRTPKGLQHEALLPVVFVPMVPGLPQEGYEADDKGNRS